MSSPGLNSEASAVALPWVLQNQREPLGGWRCFSPAPGTGSRLPAVGKSQPKDAASPDPPAVPGKAQDPFMATDHEISHSRDIS